MKRLGWEFHRVNYKDFEKDRTGEVKKIIQTLNSSSKTRPNLTGYNLTKSVPGSQSAPIPESEEAEELFGDDVQHSLIETSDPFSIEDIVQENIEEKENTIVEETETPDGIEVFMTTEVSIDPPEESNS